MLLPTDHNKLLMRWKGLLEVSAVVGLNDYRVKVKGKEKFYHVNLFKKYFERDEPTTEGAVSVVKADDHFKEDMHREIEECEVKNAEDDVNADFLEIGGYDAKESVADVTTRSNLTDEQRSEFMDLAISFQVYRVSQKFVPLLYVCISVRLDLVSNSFKPLCLSILFTILILVVPSFESNIRFVFFRAKGARARV